MSAFLVFPVFALGFLLLCKSASGTTAPSQENSSVFPGDAMQVTRDNPFKLPDVDAANDQSDFTHEFDEAYAKASHATGVPYALLKAHGFRESRFDPGACHYDDLKNGASYGLNQLEWNRDNRYAKYGYPDDSFGVDASGLFDPETNAMISALMIKDNLGWLFRGTYQGLRNVINAYNTGRPETTVEAPNNYVDDVLAAYGKIIGQGVTV